jgi:arabinofuranosyltransferase
VRSAAWGTVAIVLGSAALLVHARVFDFLCDDAFIALRFARNLIEHGAPVYNLGERVEGYTSVLWVVLVALGGSLGAPLPWVTHLLGAASGVCLMAGVWAFHRRLEPTRPVVGVLVLLAVAVTAPVAAWTLGGLETPLFAALVAWGAVLGADFAAAPTRRTAMTVAAVVLACTLARPEGVLLFAVVWLVAAAGMVRRRRGGRALVTFTLTFGVPLGAYVAWRWGYYGYPLPNTYYAKLSGDPAQLAQRGLRYIAFAGREMGWPMVLLTALGLAVPARGAEPVARAALWIARGFTVAMVLHVIRVGGDFLDLYRFLVPVFPLAIAATGSAPLRLVPPRRLHRRVEVALLVLGIALVGGHGLHQLELGDRARQVREPTRSERGIEPLGWTRLYAKRWAAMGRWIASMAEDDDWMAVGAAGAMPYYAGIRNLDTFGLCDAYVAHHGIPVGHRPGHQRFAPRSYILSKDPVFVLVGDYTSAVPVPLRRAPTWNRHGYVFVEAELTPEQHGAPQRFYHYILMRTDRAHGLMGRPHLRVARAQ